MKKILISLLVLSLMFSVSAIEQPEVDDIVVLGTIDQPIAPGTGTQGECEPWDVKNERCEGEVRHWDLCFKTVSGGKWTPKSELCSDYGSTIVCIAGTCQKSEEVSRTVMYALGALAIIIFIIWMLSKKK